MHSACSRDDGIFLRVVNSIRKDGDFVAQRSVLQARTQVRAPALARRQRGFGGFLVIALIAGMAAAAGMFTFYRTDAVQAQNERATTDVLAAAKAALIGYAVRRGGPTGTARPGELPCPDSDGDGLENAPCSTAASLLGRLPWRTLGIPEPVDSAGETLWYAISGPFRDAASNPLTYPGVVPAPAERINSDTRGNITVLGRDGSSVLSNNAVAVVFAPGAALSGQNRSPSALSVALCTLTGLTVVPHRCASNYLESSAGTSNAGSTTGPFIAGAASSAFNDRLAYLDTAELIPIIEMRVANELKRLLAAYRLYSACQCYPWADNWPYSGGLADVGQNRGRFPSGPYPEAWGQGSIPNLPQWVAANDWHNLFWYSVSRQASDAGDTCRSCSSDPTLTVDATKTAALLFTPGTPADGLARLPPVMPGASLTSAQRSRADNINLYLQDSSNRDGAACADVGEIGGPKPGSGTLSISVNCDRYVTPASTARDRDRIYMLGVATAAICASNAQALANAAPCGSAWTITNPVCQAAMPNLDSCTCASAAGTLARPPCTNTTNPSACQTALSQLNVCTS
jgi:hypothetical protein